MAEIDRGTIPTKAMTNPSSTVGTDKASRWIVHLRDHGPGRGEYEWDGEPQSWPYSERGLRIPQGDKTVYVPWENVAYLVEYT